MKVKLSSSKDSVKHWFIWLNFKFVPHP